MNKVSQQTLAFMKEIRKGTAKIIGEDELILKLEKSRITGKPLVVKLGLDPTAPDIHLGHTVVLRKLRLFQDMGHKAFLVIGDFTGRIGDPTQRDKSRPKLSKEDVLRNADTYEKQVCKVLDRNKTVICFNSEWLDEMTTSDFIELISKHSVAKMLERENVKKRLDIGAHIGMHELLYPMLQGVDSLNIDADIEIGGTDQTFNLLMGREIQKKEGKEKQVAIFMPLLEGVKTESKMSKSLGNAIGIDESAESMFEKLMMINDDQIIPYFELITDMKVDSVEDYRQQILSNRTNPKNIKLRLSQEIVTLYHGKESAMTAKNNFISVYSKGKMPKEMPEFLWEDKDTLMTFLVKNKMIASRSEVRRLVQQRGVKINDTIILEPEIISLSHGDVIKIGKKKFVKVKRNSL